MNNKLDKEQALHSFWSSFGLPAYDENTVIDPLTGKKPEPPYIVYDVSVGDLGDINYTNATIWYRSSSWSGVTEKAHEIERRFGHSEVCIPINGGYVRIWKGNPFYQRTNETNDPTLRGIVFNICAEYMTAL